MTSLATPNAFSAPGDLVEPICRAWATETQYFLENQIGRLPSPPRLRELLDTVFQTSLLAEEGRPLALHVVYAEPGFWVATKNTVVLRTIPIALAAAGPFTVQELRRFAPAVDPWTTAILVCESPVDANKDYLSLMMWGILNLRSDWERHQAGERSHPYAPPFVLTVTSGKPGRIAVGAGGRGLVLLDAGKVRERDDMPMRLHQLLPEFRPFLEHLDATVAQTFAVERLPTSEHWRFWSEGAYEAILRRLLFLASRAGHGGCFLICPSADACAAIERQILFPKYTLSSFTLFRSLVVQVANQLATMAKSYYGELSELFDRQPQFAALTSQADVVLSSAKAGAHMSSYGSHHEVDQAIDDCSRQIALFSQVDGAVLLTGELDCVAFGCEIRTTEVEALVVKRASDVIGTRTIAVSFETFGTRHRSAFRFCNTFRNAIALVVSQDGDMKLCKQHGDEVVFWEISSPGVFLE